ncbi:MAG: restriction endonuclease subunit S [Candidatus Moraniibacteriota bacterium]
MKKGWNQARLDELTEADSPITYGVVKPGDPGEVLFIRGGDLVGGRVLDNQLRTITSAVSEQYRRTLLRGGELLICLVGQPGQVAVAPASLAGANIARQVGLIRLRSSIDAEFISYFLQSPEGLAHLGTYTGGSVQQVINLSDLRTVNVPVPPLAEQQRIVGLLDEAFEGLATAKANAEKNLQNARALFESYLQSVFTQRGPGWVEKNLGDLCQIKTGKKDVNEGNPEGKYPFFTCAAAHTFSDYYSFDTEALLVAGNGNVGQVSYYSGKFEAYQRTYVLFDFKGVTAKYLFRVLDKRLSATVSKQKLGNTMPYIKIGMLTDFVVPVPPPKEQELVAESLSAIAEETQRLAHLYERKLAALEELKKSLLRQAFSGKL